MGGASVHQADDVTLLQNAVLWLAVGKLIGKGWTRINHTMGLSNPRRKILENPSLEFRCMNQRHSIHTEKSFRNLIKSNRNQIVFTMHRLIRNQTTDVGPVTIKDTQTPPPPPSLSISLLWMMGSVLYSMGKIIKQFSDFYFSSYCEKCIENWRFLEQKWR